MRASDWTPISNGSKVMGRFNLHLQSGMIIRGATLVDGRDGPFVSLPQRSYDRNGTTKYDAIIGFDSKERQEKFLKLALAAVEEARKAKAA